MRTLWRIKSPSTPQGNAENARPDYQQLWVGSDVVIWCDSSGEPDPALGLEARVRRALDEPSSVERFGGWSLGESTHMINDLWLLGGNALPGPCRTFVLAEQGGLSMPVWVDHVSSGGTVHASGRLEMRTEAPSVEQVPIIPLARPAESGRSSRRKR